MGSAECGGFLPVCFWKCGFEKDRSGVFLFGAYSRQIRPPRGVNPYLKKKVVESHVGEEKKSFAQIDSLKRGSVRFERKFFLRLHAIKVWKMWCLNQMLILIVVSALR